MNGHEEAGRGGEWLIDWVCVREGEQAMNERGSSVRSAPFIAAVLCLLESSTVTSAEAAMVILEWHEYLFSKHSRERDRWLPDSKM